MLIWGHCHYGCLVQNVRGLRYSFPDDPSSMMLRACCMSATPTSVQILLEPIFDSVLLCDIQTDAAVRDSLTDGRAISYYIWRCGRSVLWEHSLNTRGSWLKHILRVRARHVDWGSVRMLRGNAKGTPLDWLLFLGICLANSRALARLSYSSTSCGESLLSREACSLGSATFQY